MNYLGSKNKIAKLLLPIMLAERGDRPWVEPFVGGANMIDKVDGVRIGNDIHGPLIALLKAIQGGWIPPAEVSRAVYHCVKVNQDSHAPEVLGFIGFLCSFGGKWWAGYASNKRGDNFAARGSRLLAKQAKNLKGVDFRHGSYLEMEIPPRSLIYCDPPYEGLTKYRDAFEHDVFWDWCRAKTEEGHIVYVSECKAPGDFECVKTVDVQSPLGKDQCVKRTEKLFRRKGE